MIMTSVFLIHCQRGFVRFLIFLTSSEDSSSELRHGKHRQRAKGLRTFERPGFGGHNEIPEKGGQPGGISRAPSPRSRMSEVRVGVLPATGRWSLWCWELLKLFKFLLTNLWAFWIIYLKNKLVKKNSNDKLLTSNNNGNHEWCYYYSLLLTHYYILHSVVLLHHYALMHFNNISTLQFNDLRGKLGPWTLERRPRLPLPTSRVCRHRR